MVDALQRPEVVLRAGARTGERLVVVRGDRDAVSVPEGVRVATQSELGGGTRAWYHEELAGRRWRVSARSFFQARPDGAEALVDAVRAALTGAPSGHVVDLYGGVGLFAGTVDADRVTLVESGASSVADAKVNLRDRDVRTVKVDVGRFDRNVDIAERYKVPLKKGIPAVAVLSPQGQLLYATEGGELANARKMGDQGIYEFFTRIAASAR